MFDWLKFWKDTDDESDDRSKDSSYEDEFISRCDHEFEKTTELLNHPSLNEAEIVGSYLVLPQYERVEEYCKFCGEPGFKGEPDSRFGNAAGLQYDGVYTQVGRKVAAPIHLLDQEDKIPQDIPSNNEKETTVIEGEGDGRIIVNESEQEADEAADEEEDDEEEDEDDEQEKPAAAGGATD